MLRELHEAGVSPPKKRRGDEVLYDWATVRVVGYRLRSPKWSLPSLRAAWRGWTTLRAQRGESGPPVPGEHPRVRLDNGAIFISARVIGPAPQIDDADAAIASVPLPLPPELEGDRVYARAGEDEALKARLLEHARAVGRAIGRSLRVGVPDRNAEREATDRAIAEAVRAVEAYDAALAAGRKTSCMLPAPCQSLDAGHEGCRAARALFAAVDCDGRTARPKVLRRFDSGGEWRLDRDPWREDLDAAIAFVDREFAPYQHRWADDQDEDGSFRCCAGCGVRETALLNRDDEGPRARCPGTKRQGTRRIRAILIVERCAGIPSKRIRQACGRVPK